MTITRHELRRGKTSWLIWTGAIAFLLATCIFLYPEMKGQMDGIGDVFSSMGSFTAAFGMDKLNFGTLIGYYAIECGNVLGLGGAFFAALLAAAMLAKEEKDRTAEFLLTHPVSRVRVVSEKLLAVFLQVTALNLVIWLIAVGSIAAIGEAVPWKEVCLLHLAYYLMQLVVAGICFGVSAFMRKGSAGAGIGIAAGLYVMNLIANITESVSFLNTITPFGFCSGADIVSTGTLDGKGIAVGFVLCALGILAAYLWYPRKDIH